MVIDFLRKKTRRIGCCFGYHGFDIKKGQMTPIIIDGHNATLVTMKCPYCGKIRYDILIKDSHLREVQCLGGHNDWKLR